MGDLPGSADIIVGESVWWNKPKKMGVPHVGHGFFGLAIALPTVSHEGTKAQRHKERRGGQMRAAVRNLLSLVRADWTRSDIGPGLGGKAPSFFVP